MTNDSICYFSKVPAITLGFWIIKILATTLGETAGDTVSMTLDWGYLAGTALFAAFLIILAYWQIRSGTTFADFATGPRWIDLSRPLAFVVLAIAILTLPFLIPQRAGVSMLR